MDELSSSTKKRLQSKFIYSASKNDNNSSLTLPSISNNQSNFSKIEITLPMSNKDMQASLAHRRSQFKYISSQLLDNLTQNFQDALLIEQKKDHLQVLLKRKIKAKPKNSFRRQLKSDFDILEEEQEHENQNRENPEMQSAILRPIYRRALNVYWIAVDQTLWRPAVRESCAMALLDRTIYMYGGLGLELYGDLMKLDASNFKWSSSSLSLMCLTEEPKGRFGHTISASRNALYVYGGETKTRGKGKSLCPEMHRYDIELQTWKILKTNGMSVKPRRSHAADFLGRNLIIIGGIGKRGDFLNDFITFNTSKKNLEIFLQETLRYSELSLEDKANPFKDGIAYHCMCSIFETDKLSTNLYQSLDQASFEVEKQVRKEGVYIYGGMNSLNLLYEELFQIETQAYPCKISQLQTKGVKPPPLCMHTMTHNYAQQFLIIYGGKTELTSTIFNQEIFILSLKYLSWMKVNQKGNAPAERACHSAISIDSRIIFFGGFNLKGYVSSLVSVLELDKQLMSDSRVKLQTLERQNSEEVKQLKSELKSPSYVDLQIQRREIIKEISQLGIEMKESLKLKPMVISLIKSPDDEHQPFFLKKQLELNKQIQ